MKLSAKRALEMDPTTKVYIPNLSLAMQSDLERKKI